MPIGLPITNYTLHVLDQHQLDVPVDVVGELLVVLACSNAISSGQI